MLKNVNLFFRVSRLGVEGEKAFYFLTEKVKIYYEQNVVEPNRRTEKKD